MSKKVVYARLHASLFVPGISSDLGTTLPPANKTLLKLDMEALGDYGIEGGLLLKFEFKGLRKTLLIPSANVIQVELVADAPKPEAAKKEK